MSLFNQFDVTWAEAIDGPGGAQMGYFKTFYEQQRFWELYPYEEGADAVGNPFGKKLPLVTTTKDRRRFVLYYPASTRKSGELHGFCPGAYEMRWFHPESGEYTTATAFTLEGGTWRIPKKPDAGDWCLVVEKKED